MKIKPINILLLLFVIPFFFPACNSDSGNPPPQLGPPSSLVGKTYRFDITSATVVFFPSGYYTINFIDSNQYNLIGDKNDGGLVSDSTGTYTYSFMDNEGTISMTDSIYRDYDLTLTFSPTTSGSGRFEIKINSPSEPRQFGTFTEQ